MISIYKNTHIYNSVELEKAFDRVPREMLYCSLRRKGISEKL